MISYCQAVQDRLHHLEVTLPHTLEVLRSSDELVILDYSSTDGLSDWLLSSDLPSNVRVYQLTEGRQHWHMARAKNIAHLLGSQPVLCNLDADNWLTAGFSASLDDLAQEEVRQAPITCTGGGCGRVALHRDTFLALGGYDHRMRSWGYDVTDLIARATRHGYTVSTFSAQLIAFCEHPDIERTTHEYASLLQSCARNRQFSLTSALRNETCPNRVTAWDKFCVSRLH